MHLSADIWVWVGVFLTFCIYSFLYRDNHFYKFGEHLFVGVSNAFTLSFMVHRIIIPVMIRPFVTAWRTAGSEGMSWSLWNPYAPSNFLVIIPGLIGCFYFARFIPKSAGWCASPSASSWATTSAARCRPRSKAASSRR